MPKRSKNLKLAAFLSGSGSHLAGWRHPDTELNSITDIDYYIDYARRLEAAGFDAIFLNDNFALQGLTEDVIARYTHTSRWDPLVLLPALAVATKHIGLIATANTSFNAPFNIARYFASLDILSKGRAGWNVVTALGGAENFNLEQHLAHDERYARAEEFVDVVNKLWHSWDQDAFIQDKATGIWVDPKKMHLADHEGRFFKVSGPLNVAPSPQGKPVIAQAGSSVEGIQLAARTADIIFTAQQEMHKAQNFYRHLKYSTRQYQRSPDDVLILAGLSTVVGKSREEAQQKYQQLQENLDPVLVFEHILPFLNLDLNQYMDLSQPVVIHQNIQQTEGHQSRQQLIVEWIEKNQPTYRELLYFLGGGGHKVLVGTAKDIVDEMQSWYESSACDGFMLMFSHLPDALTDFTAEIIPELVRRDLFSTHHYQATLRQTLGLS